MSYICFDIKEIPDLTLNKYQSLADTGVDGVLERHSSFLRQWHGICMESRSSFHLLYLFQPSESKGKRLKLYFIVQGEMELLQQLKPLLLKSPISDFYNFIESELPDISFTSGATLLKKERVANIFNPLTGTEKSVHYVPSWSTKENARLYDMFRIMETVGTAYSSDGACAYRVDLYPTSTVEETRTAFTPIIKELQGDYDIKLVRDDMGGNHDSYASNVCKEYEDWLSKIESAPHFRVNIYAFASDGFLSKIILNSAGSEALDEGDFSLAPLKTNGVERFTTTSRMFEGARSYCFYPNNAKLNDWSTTYSLDEIEPFFRLPVLYDGENIELPKETSPQQFENGIYFGEDDNGYSVNFPIANLARHAFFTGMPGSGKTNTMLHIISELQKNDIPFLVLEPAKKEYRELLTDSKNSNVYLFSPHLQSHFPLRVNPFEFPKGYRLSDHLTALLEVFQGSFVLEGPTYTFLSKAIQKAYEDLGWDVEDINGEEDLPYPTFQSVYNNIEEQIKHSKYDSEIKGNVQSFLQVRLGGLMERDAGELFDTPMSTFAPEEWLSKSVIVELETLGEQAKNFFILLVCHYIYETLQIDPKGGKDPETGLLKPIRHVVFIEEAHNIIAPQSEQTASDSVDPKVAATSYIVKMLAEVRALREAIIIADQLPTALTDKVTKNTGLKLVHRLTSRDDRELIGSAISASPMQLEQVAAFTKGKALIHYEGTQRPYGVQIAKWKNKKVDYNFSNDYELFNEISCFSTVKDSIELAYDSWKDKVMQHIQDDLTDLQAEIVDFKNEENESRLSAIEKKARKLMGKLDRIGSKNARCFELWSIEDIFEELVDNFISFDEVIDDLISSVKNDVEKIGGLKNE